MIRLETRFGDASPPRPKLYRIADELLVCDLDLDVLKPFQVEAASSSDSLAPISSEGIDWNRAEFPDLLDSGIRDLGGLSLPITCRRGEAGYLLDLDRCGSFAITPAGDLASCLRPPENEDQWPLALLGPVLILALALRGVFCLHGSAVASSNQAELFLGSSGVGKSTLAAFLTDYGRTRIADDIVALRLPHGVLPRFPQLKLPPDQQTTSIERIPLRRIYLLRRGSQAKIHFISTTEIILALVEHTVASRFFDRDLLKANLRFCGALSTAARTRPLEIPPLERLADVPGILKEKV